MTHQEAILTELGQRALEYAKRGWHVLPVKAGTKGRDENNRSTHHLPNGHNGASCDPDQVRAWWTAWPDANIGLNLSASGLVALDPDTYKTDCMWFEFIKDRDLPDTLTQTSARGGKHHIFAAPPSAKFEGKVCAGVDIKHKGYIMLEPSTFEGKTYRLDNNRDPAPVPDWVPRKGQRSTPPPRGGVDIDTGTFGFGGGPTLAEVAEALTYIPADLPYEDWCSVLMALHDEFGAAGLPLADQWSASGTTYTPGEVAGKFKSFKPGGGITIKRVFGLAKDNGCDLSELTKKHRGERREARKEAFKTNPPDINPAALKIAKQITKSIRESLPDLKDDPFVDPLIICDMIEGAFWSGAKSRMFLLTPDESLVQFVANDAWKFLCRRFGSPVDPDEILKQLEKDVGRKLDPSDALLARREIRGAPIGPIIDHVKYNNQRDAVEWTVDMFGQRSRLELRDGVARLVLTHKTLAVPGKADPACIADYREHFPLIDEMLEYIVAARFALDRKKAYLWILASSDWGKGFLMGALGALGLVVETSVKEIEAMLEGKAVGRNTADFKRAMILAVDEFKTVKSEIKRLGSYIELAPKFQLTTRVEIFTKLFLSAESVGSLVGESGVEDQFANRMSLLTGSATLNGRAVYQANKAKYFWAVTAYVAQVLNRLIGEYQALGREGSELRADKYLDAFIGRHGLDQYFERLSDSYQSIAEPAVEWIRATKMTQSYGGHEYITHANKAFNDFLNEHYDRSEIGTLSRRKTEIMALMSEDGRGNASYRLNGRVVKAIKLKA